MIFSCCIQLFVDIVIIFKLQLNKSVQHKYKHLFMIICQFVLIKKYIYIQFDNGIEYYCNY